jgi:hypothetical protein
VAWLFWTGLALAPVAALVLLLGQGVGPLRVAAVLAVASTVLIGLSVTFRQDITAVSGDISQEINDGLTVVHRELDVLRNTLDSAVRREADRVREELRREMILRGSPGSPVGGSVGTTGVGTTGVGTTGVGTTGAAGAQGYPASPASGYAATSPASGYAASEYPASGYTASGYGVSAPAETATSVPGSAGFSVADVEAAAARKAAAQQLASPQVASAQAASQKPASQQWAAPAWDTGEQATVTGSAAQKWAPPAWEGTPGSPYSSDLSDRTGRFSPSAEAAGSTGKPRTSWAFDPPDPSTRSGSFPAIGSSASRATPSRPGTGSFPAVSSAASSATPAPPASGSFPAAASAQSAPSSVTASGSLPVRRPGTGSFPTVSGTPSRPATGSFPRIPARPSTGSFPAVSSTPSRPGTGSFPTVNRDPSGSFAANAAERSGSFPAVPPGGPVRRRRAADGNEEEPDITGDLARAAGLPDGTMYNPVYGSGHDPLAPPPPQKGGRGRKGEPADPHGEQDPSQWPPESPRYRPRHGY